MKVCQLIFDYNLRLNWFKFLVCDDEILKIYWKTEEKCRKVTKLMPCYPLILMFVAAVIYSIYCMLTGNRDTTTWILPYRMIVPFDTVSIHGWYLLWFIQSNVGFSYSVVMVTISSYFACCCFYIQTLCDHFEYLIDSLKNIVEENPAKGNVSLSERKRLKMKETLSQAVCIHIKTFEFVNFTLQYLNHFSIASQSFIIAFILLPDWSEW